MYRVAKKTACHHCRSHRMCRITSSGTIVGPERHTEEHPVRFNLKVLELSSEHSALSVACHEVGELHVDADGSRFPSGITLGIGCFINRISNTFDWRA
ncbi:hypothetical protein J6590_098079 [Homalodisca vitripennis]|nr:hypothetical protein J6590_096447 [Homalodisca vitripennis]KAG8315589.1 hypothetical protein J6590_067504 [Homalodisca vitripennis]KAG8324197.1 hypothetical protein J6590_098079 [Homalodisca vitripennis]